MQVFLFNEICCGIIGYSLDLKIPSVHPPRDSKKCPGVVGKSNYVVLGILYFAAPMKLSNYCHYIATHNWNIEL